MFHRSTTNQFSTRRHTKTEHQWNVSIWTKQIWKRSVPCRPLKTDNPLLCSERMSRSSWLSRPIRGRGTWQHASDRVWHCYVALHQLKSLHLFPLLYCHISCNIFHLETAAQPLQSCAVQAGHSSVCLYLSTIWSKIFLLFCVNFSKSLALLRPCMQTYLSKSEKALVPRGYTLSFLLAV